MDKQPKHIILRVLFYGHKLTHGQRLAPTQVKKTRSLDRDVSSWGNIFVCLFSKGVFNYTTLRN